MKFPVGTKYIHYADKNKRVSEVIDYLITTNLKREIVKSVYVVETDYMGQSIKSEVPEATISRSLLNS